MLYSHFNLKFVNDRATWNFNKLVIVHFTERVVQGIMQLYFSLYKVGSCDNHHYPSSECGNGSCFEVILMHFWAVKYLRILYMFSRKKSESGSTAPTYAV
jgi:hypothetical protein